MDGDNRATTGSGFSWVPPRSTVMLVSPKPSRRSDSKKPSNSKSFAAPPVYGQRPEGDFQRELMIKEFERLKMNSRERSKSSIDCKKGKKKERPRSSTYHAEQDGTKEAKTPVIENEILPENTANHEASGPAYESLYHPQQIGERITEKPKKKSVFAMKDLQDGVVDIDNLLSRKISNESNNDKFVSVSYEAQRNRKTNIVNPTPRNVHGGMYARKVAKKRQNGDGESSNLAPVSEGTIEVERKRKTSKFVNSLVRKDESFDVDDLLSRRRKESEESSGSEKFISICWQREELTSNGSNQEGGIYAKRVQHSKKIS